MATVAAAAAPAAGFAFRAPSGGYQPAAACVATSCNQVFATVGDLAASSHLFLMPPMATHDAARSPSIDIGVEPYTEAEAEASCT